MCNKDTISDKFQKLRQYRLDRLCLQHHLIRNAGQIRNLKWDWTLRIYKGAESVHDFSVDHLHCTDLDDLIPDRTKSGRLDVKYNVCVIECLLSRIHCDVCQVIYHITFHTIDDLEWILFIQCLNVMICIRECLCHTVVCDCDRRMPPVMGSLYDRLYLRHTIHIAHLRMTVKFYTFQRIQILPCHGEISDLLDSCDRTDRQLSVKFVDGRHALDLDKCTLFQISQNFRKLFIAGKHFYSDRICKICHGKNDDRFFISNLTCIKLNDLSVDRNLTHLSNNCLQFDWLILKIPSVDQIRIIPDLHRTHIIFLKVLLAEFALASGISFAKAGFCVPCHTARSFLLSAGCTRTGFGQFHAICNFRSVFAAFRLPLRSLDILASLSGSPFKDSIDLLLDSLLIILSRSVPILLSVSDANIRRNMEALFENRIQKRKNLFLSSF